MIITITITVIHHTSSSSVTLYALFHISISP